jgi:hypothetical protein
MGAVHIFDRAYKGVDLTPIPAGRVVVAGSNPGEAQLPGAANAGAILGVTMQSQPASETVIAVRKAGVALVEAAGAITLGAPVNIAGTTGRVKAISESANTKINCVGFAETAAAEAGDLIEVFISLHERIAP